VASIFVIVFASGTPFECGVIVFATRRAKGVVTIFARCVYHRHCTVCMDCGTDGGDGVGKVRLRNLVIE
jgi:hypothetical protein